MCSANAITKHISVSLMVLFVLSNWLWNVCGFFSLHLSAFIYDNRLVADDFRLYRYAYAEARTFLTSQGFQPSKYIQNETNKIENRKYSKFSRLMCTIRLMWNMKISFCLFSICIHSNTSRVYSESREKCCDTQEYQCKLHALQV